MVIRSLLVLAVASLVLAACGSGNASPSSGSATPAVPATPDASASPSAGPGSSQAASPAATVGLAFVSALAGGDMAAAEAMEDATMRGAAPAAALTQLWSQLEGQFGAFTGVGDVAVKDAAPFVNATVTAYFANATVPLIVTVDAEGHVAGFHLGAPGPAASPPGGSSATPAAPSPTPAGSAAAYVRPDAFTETEVTVGSAPWALPGTLSMPTGSGPFPAMVLVAGSGPQDRDETIGPNAPLRDLAWGLASNGIAVLRYDKRTKAHGTEMASQVDKVTVREEVTDDAIAAVDLLRATPGIDPERVFLAGHSLGGYLAPRIAADASGRLAGIALLEANARPLQRLDRGSAGVSRLGRGRGRPLGQGDAGRPAGPGGARRIGGSLAGDARIQPAARDPGRVLAGSPRLRPGGDRPGPVDPDVHHPGRQGLPGAPDRAGGLADGLGDRAGVTIREYPSLNHLLMAGPGPAGPRSTRSRGTWRRSWWRTSPRG